MTVRTLFLKLVRRVAPYSRDGVEVTTGNLNDITLFDRFTRSRLVDIYNEARVALFQELLRQPDVVSSLSEFIEVEDDITVSGGEFPKPDGFVQALSLVDTTEGVDYQFISPAEEKLLQTESLPSYTESTSQRFAVSRGDSIAVYPTSLNLALTYLKFTDVLESDIIAGSPIPIEKINRRFHSHLLELGAAIASEYSLNEVAALARSLLGVQDDSN